MIESISRERLNAETNQDDGPRTLGRLTGFELKRIDSNEGLYALMINTTIPTGFPTQRPEPRRFVSEALGLDLLVALRAILRQLDPSAVDMILDKLDALTATEDQS